MKLKIEFTLTRDGVKILQIMKSKKKDKKKLTIKSR